MELRSGRKIGGNRARPLGNRRRQANVASTSSLAPPVPAVANNTLDSFTRFRDLPVELRTMIWQDMIKHRVIISDDDRPQPVPLVLQICSESRQEGLRFYKLAQIHRFDETTSQYLHKEDILFIAALKSSLEQQVDESFNVLMSGSIGKEVRQIAIREDVWQIWERSRMGQKDEYDLATENMVKIVIVKPREGGLAGKNMLILSNDGHEIELEQYKAGMDEGVVSKKKPEFEYGQILRSRAPASTTEIIVAPKDWETTLQFAWLEGKAWNEVGGEEDHYAYYNYCIESPEYGHL